MPTQNRVVWSEGLFIKPQHFQQETRHFDYLLNQRMAAAGDYLFGFSAFEINPEYLTFGKVGLLHAAGVMPDGSVFDIPHETAQPDPLVVNDVSLEGQTVYLAVPLRSPGTVEVQWPEYAGRHRYIAEQSDTKDLHSKAGAYSEVKTAGLNACLMLEREDRSAFSCLALARIQSVRADNSLALDPGFYPTALAVTAIAPLQRFLDETAELARERARYLAERVNSPTQSGVADVADFMLLQSINRLHPLFLHLSHLPQLHPERLYSIFTGACGELATFSENSRLPERYPAYQHENCKPAFVPLMEALRRGLGMMMEARAVSIPIYKEQYGTWSAPVNDRSLIGGAEFILSVKAEIPAEQILAEFAQLVKVASLEKISQLINLQLPGIPLIPLPVAPRHLPYHAGFSYFQLDRNNPAYAEMMAESAGFGFHITGNLPELELQLWAIRAQGTVS